MFVSGSNSFSFVACPAGEVSFEEFAKMLGPRPGRHEDASFFACKGQNGLRPGMLVDAKGCDWCQRLRYIVMCIGCGVDACHDCTSKHLESVAQPVTCKARRGLVTTRMAGVKKHSSSCGGHIAENATVVQLQVSVFRRHHKV